MKTNTSSLFAHLNQLLAADDHIQEREVVAVKYEADVERLFQSYYDTVYKIAYTQLKDKSNADDILQEVFLRLVRYKERLLSDEHAKAWLIRVTINCCKSHFLSTWNKRTVGLEEEILTGSNFNEEELGIFEEIMKLPKQYGLVMHLFYYEGFSIQEIANYLGKKENTIKSHLFRGRNLLREKLKGEIELGGE